MTITSIIDDGSRNHEVSLIFTLQITQAQDGLDLKDAIKNTIEELTGHVWKCKSNDNELYITDNDISGIEINGTPLTKEEVKEIKSRDFGIICEHKYGWSSIIVQIVIKKDLDCYEFADCWEEDYIWDDLDLHVIENHRHELIECMKIELKNNNNNVPDDEVLECDLNKYEFQINLRKMSQNRNHINH